MSDTNKTIKEYREALKSGKRWDVYATYRNDKGKKGYYELTLQERIQVDLHVDSAKESL